MELKIKTTSDGSATLFVPELNEHYHSTNGAVQESMHVFIRSGLNEIKNEEIKILEVGFGTGLNALLTLIKCNVDQKVEYHAVELNPLEWSLIKKLGYGEYLNLTENQALLFKEIHQVRWDTSEWIDPVFCLRKINAAISDFEPAGNYNLIYFDAFAPEVQPDMWSQEVFRKMYNSLSEGGILVTYCAKGEVRRCMQTSGFMVERLPGAPGKREMLRGRKSVL
jgi:tRNA U34 5-methylaminomethyl-2-thiouridine-forming methyltransferase MnmC